jgi:hypothetical protein
VGFVKHRIREWLGVGFNERRINDAWKAIRKQNEALEAAIEDGARPKGLKSPWQS